MCNVVGAGVRRCGRGWRTHTALIWPHPREWKNEAQRSLLDSSRESSQRELNIRADARGKGEGVSARHVCLSGSLELVSDGSGKECLLQSGKVILAICIKVLGAQPVTEVKVWVVVQEVSLTTVRRQAEIQDKACMAGPRNNCWCGPFESFPSKKWPMGFARHGEYECEELHPCNNM